MNKTPSILVDTGFEVDQNGALTEIDVPNVVDTLRTPTKITFNGTTLKYIPSTAGALQEFEAPNMTSIVTNSGFTNFKDYTALTSISFANVETMTNEQYGAFYHCTRLINVNMPRLRAINNTNNGDFEGCTALSTILLPCLQSSTTTTRGTFYGCTGLQNVTLGSEGNAVTALSSNTFTNCTQYGLTITIYTTGGAALSGEPWGATNATIEYEEA